MRVWQAVVNLNVFPAEAYKYVRRLKPVGDGGAVRVVAATIHAIAQVIPQRTFKTIVKLGCTVIVVAHTMFVIDPTVWCAWRR